MSQHFEGFVAVLPDQALSGQIFAHTWDVNLQSCVCRLSPMEYHEREEILKLRAVALKKVKDCHCLTLNLSMMIVFTRKVDDAKRHFSSILHGLNCS